MWLLLHIYRNAFAWCDRLLLLVDETYKRGIEIMADGKDKNSMESQSAAPERPKKGLEDWEMLQPRDEKPLNIPFWIPILVVGLILVAVLLSFPMMGVREGYERPWLDWGILVAVGYGVVSLLAIYFIMRRRKKAAIAAKSEDDSSKNN